MAQDGGSGAGDVGCFVAVAAIVAVIAAAGYGVFRLVQDRSAPDCRVLVVESNGETQLYIAPEHLSIDYELDGERLEATLPPGTTPSAGTIIVNGVRRVECSNTLPAL